MWGRRGVKDSLSLEPCGRPWTLLEETASPIYSKVCLYYGALVSLHLASEHIETKGLSRNMCHLLPCGMVQPSPVNVPLSEHNSLESTHQLQQLLMASFLTLNVPRLCDKSLQDH